MYDTDTLKKKVMLKPRTANTRGVQYMQNSVHFLRLATEKLGSLADPHNNRSRFEKDPPVYDTEHSPHPSLCLTLYMTGFYCLLHYIGALLLSVETLAFSSPQTTSLLLNKRTHRQPLSFHKFRQSPPLIRHGRNQVQAKTALSALPRSAVAVAVLLRGGEVSELAMGAYDWCVNLCSPSALVAGAVIATIYENIGSGALDIASDDSKWVRTGKRVTRLLLLSAFAFEIISIFVTTVTGPS